MNRWTLAALLWLPPMAAAAQAPKVDPARPSAQTPGVEPSRPSAQAPRVEPARAALLRTDVEWAKQAAMGKDVERIVSYLADDAVVYPPKEPQVSGKAAIRAYVANSLKTPWFSIDWKPAQAGVAASGDIGYTTGTNTITVPDSNGKVTTSKGRYLTVWRRAANGPWRCVVDFWNEAPIPPLPLRPARPPRK